MTFFDRGLPRVLCRLLLLALFAFSFIGHPIGEALSPHHDDCAVCVVISHGTALADPGPSLTRVQNESPAPLGPAEAFASGLRGSLHFGRGPPVS